MRSLTIPNLVRREIIELFCSNRNGEAFAALGATAFKNGAASGSFHTLTESVATTTFGAARLKCALHIKTSY
jgi:hypothetical protein